MKLKQSRAVTISAGLAGLGMDAPQTAETLAKQADEAMYRAKKIPGHAVELPPVLKSGQQEPPCTTPCTSVHQSAHRPKNPTSTSPP